MKTWVIVLIVVIVLALIIAIALKMRAVKKAAELEANATQADIPEATNKQKFFDFAANALPLVLDKLKENKAAKSSGIGATVPA